MWEHESFRSMDDQSSRIIQRQSCCKIIHSSDKKYCLLVDSPDKTSTPTVDLPASAHLKTFGWWIFIEDQPDSDNYQQIIIEDQPDYQPDSDNYHQIIIEDQPDHHQIIIRSSTRF